MNRTKLYKRLYIQPLYRIHHIIVFFKYFIHFRYNIIPVVYGLADYKKIAPPKSSINVMDFKEVEELADYLKYLDKNDTAFNEYFR